MRTRNRSIRAKIISLLLVPLIALVAMWGLVTTITLGPGLELLDGQTNLENVGRPMQAFGAQMQAERKLTAVYLATNRADPSALITQRKATDEAIGTLRRLATGDDAQNALTENSRRLLTTLFTKLDTVADLRGRVDRGQIDRNAAITSYTEIMDASAQVSSSLVRTVNEDLLRESRSLLSFSRGREILAQEDAIVSAALAGGVFAPGDVGRVASLIGAQRFAVAESLPSMNATDQQKYAELVLTDDFSRLAAMENRIMNEGRAGQPVPVSTSAWTTTYQSVVSKLREFSLAASERLIDRSTPAAIRVFINIGLAGVLGLIAVIITIVASFRIARGLIKRLAGLRQAAQELAVDRLPRVVERLRHGEDVDVAHDAPFLPYSDDEIGQVGHAFNELQRTAVNSAIEEANVRRGLNEVFLNIARRSQTLLHRQLEVLDRMERRADDPNELEDLFRIDHLATRMRRHAEDLVILAGAAPGRGWRNPVPVVDVLRGAVSEVEDYARVSIRPMPELAIAGRAVADVIHLLAELIENATSFSPPHTRVNVGGELVPHGFAIEIEDRGLGMAPEAIAECNARLADPPDFDPANSAQLGLFVVARLAARHGVRVSLRSSPYGGITAVALLPETLVAGTTGAISASPHSPVWHTVAETNGTVRGALYRELSTAQRPAITAPPAIVGESVVTDPADTPPAGPRHARQEVIPSSDNGDGLPRRVRQRSLAPQLRDVPPATADGQTSGDIATHAGATRSPEDLRAMMTSFQSGMDRGRRDADAVPDAGNGGAPGRDEQ